MAKQHSQNSDSERTAHDQVNLHHRISQAVQRVSVSIPPKVFERTSETRANGRFVPRQRHTSLGLKNGKKYDAQIMNLSAHGVALEADFSKIKIEDVISVGSRSVTHIRILRMGGVFRFVNALGQHECTANIIL
jgi:hypothetical protein